MFGKKTTATPKPRTKVTRIHVIDGVRYKSANDVKYHNELKNNPYVKSFHLPDVKEKSEYSRYGAHKCVINDNVFDSVMEGRYYAYLLEQVGEKKLKSFQMQVQYELTPSFKDKKGKTVRPITYIADFVLEYPDGSKEVIDVKGKKTPEFRIKEKLLKYVFPELIFTCIQWDSSAKAWRDLDDIEKDKRARKRAAKKKTA